MTRAELKQSYAALAKLSHPDAVRRGTADPNLEFTEIAAAWEILSDSKQRKRYDRSLQAAEFSQKVETWAAEAWEQASPFATEFAKMTIPFLRKTTASTLAGVQAAATVVSGQQEEELLQQQQRQQRRQQQQQWQYDSEKGKTMGPTDGTGFQAAQNNPDASSGENMASDGTEANRPGMGAVFRTALDAARLAGQYVDSLELFEEAQNLEDRAERESKEGQRLKEDLQTVVAKRLKVTLHTPRSGLTSAEAAVLLEDLNRTVVDRVNLMDRAMLKHTVLEEIDILRQVEGGYVQVQRQDTAAQDVYRERVQGRLEVVEYMTRMELEETEARQRLQEIQELLRKAKFDLDDRTRSLAQAEIQAKQFDFELQRLEVSLERQSEKVRQSLCHKEKQVRTAKERMNMPEAAEWYLEEDDSPERYQALKELSAEERLIQEESRRLEFMAARLSSRAKNLQLRAQELERSQK
jgi:curved DNA-binding protein CbpA